MELPANEIDDNNSSMEASDPGLHEAERIMVDYVARLRHASLATMASH